MVDNLKSWRPPATWHKFTTLDVHTAGEPFRVITSGIPEISGDTILARRQYMKNQLDHIRTALMWEPRGHADMYGCIITPPVSSEADFGVLFLHNEGYSTMCGHGIIGIATVAAETGMVPAEKPVTRIGIDTPAGFVTAYARIDNKSVKSVYFHNVSSFVFAVDETIHVPGVGEVKYDIAFGGAYYAYVQADDLGLRLTPESFSELIKTGMEIKRTISDKRPISHPVEPDLGFLYGTIFIGPPQAKNAHSRNVCVFAEGEVDRSPTGTGVSGRLALHYAKGEIQLGEEIRVESIIGSIFSGKVSKTAKFGPYDAVIPEVEGSAYITGRHEFFIDPEDPLRKGFILR